MKSRTVITLWAIAILLGITAYLVKFQGNDEDTTQTQLSPGQNIIEQLPIRSITGVTLSQGDQSTQLVRLDQDGGQVWGVAERDNYALNYELLRNLLGALGELEVTQGYPSSREHYGRFGLKTESDTPSDVALRVTMTGKDGDTIAEVFLGKYSGTSRTGGRFLRITGDGSGVYAVGETFPGITASPKDWLNKEFLKIEHIQSIALSAPADPEFKPWKLVRNPNSDGTPNPKGQFTLEGMTDQEIMKLTSTNPLLNIFSYSAFKDILSEKEAATSANPDAKLKRQALITTSSGLTYTLDFWPQNEQPKDPNSDPRLPGVQPTYLLTIKVTSGNKETPAPGIFKDRIYQISQSTISPLQKKRSDFVTSKNKPSVTTPPVHAPAQR
ncbi:MAG: DUF4340 domain-containing protein [Verrucomicrobiae bacterium]|nr:DUF4340 domain-containing protein [Verrucomicrobiae bacterium]NNJ42978.1 DUF4340 domain-containing protein [Akkermansiaceae bacterium]